MKKEVKNWWAIIIAVHSHSDIDNDFFDKETHLIFADSDSIIQASLLMLVKDFHDMLCPKTFYEEKGTEQKCNHKEFFIKTNKEADINFSETATGAEIKVTDGRTICLTYNCLEANGKFNSIEAMNISKTIAMDIKNMLTS